ncbi:universal stress protein [Nocardia sp. NPDC003482]|jgi:nucleotide-binding universal stress UspA family protein|uniref:Universal stress protein n=1 Tax=Nocardia nova TaxID=37330 RepID=A0A2S5ZWI8_9NOCA|nr:MULTISPECIES: universal stress protein [Nocardia]MDN2495294.1 universal stress protein [Nocardia nova]PPJ10765.1 universal stress protein [Nocardia nova]PPJ17354.1 universal stress protein [Nocardia nova]PPJ21942.1 universal stress protein [Nocardia nova]
MTTHHHTRIPRWLHTLTGHRHPHPTPENPPHTTPTARPIRTIIVDTDPADRDYRAVDHAADLAHASRARLLITCVHHPLDLHTLTDDLDRLRPDDYQLRGTTPTDTILRTATDHARAHGAPHIETHLLPEPAQHSLLQLATTQHADLIVVTQPTPHTWADRATSHILDTPAIKLARHTPCDILIIPTTR